jgi:hypothetical protein
MFAVEVIDCTRAIPGREQEHRQFTVVEVADTIYEVCVVGHKYL